MIDASYTTLTEELRENGMYASNTSGTSMRPLLRHHRDVVILTVPSEEVKKYDVVLYPGKSGKYILHRVIGRKGDTLIIRGDNTYVKEFVDKAEIMAVLTAFNRGGKRHTCEELGYRVYSRIWCAIYPVRLLAYKLRLALARVYRAIFKRGKATERGESDAE